MARSREKFQERFSFVSSPEDWMERKKKMDGAEGLWRIHDKLYDFTVWARTHPGGKFWIDATRGTDITEAFESHHLSEETESLLGRFYRREAQTQRNSSVTFGENGFHRVFKRKVFQQNLTPAQKSVIQFDALVAVVFLTALAGALKGICWTVASGLLLGVLSTSSHDFLHMKDNWRLKYFNLSLMSSREWRVRHVLSHHQTRDTNLDLEIPILQPLLLLPVKSDKSFAKFLRLILTPFVFAISAHIQFLKRVSDVFLSRKLGFHSEELVAFSLPLFLFCFSGSRPLDVFINWSIIIMVGSFFFCFFGAFPRSCDRHISLERKSERDEIDFGQLQLSLAGDPRENLSVVSFLNSFRGNVLHYLCPTVDCGSLNKLIPAFEETCEELGVLYKKGELGLFEEFQNRLPDGHVFFS